jgi:hypothetical protein
MLEAEFIRIIADEGGKGREKAYGSMRTQRLTIFAWEGQRAVFLLDSSSVIKKISLSL